MAYAFVQDVPITLEIYEQLKAEIGAEVPKGLIVHVVAQIERGLRYFDVWESKAEWEQFRDERVHPAIERVFSRIGFQRPAGEPPMRELDVREVWKP
jgi:hypothetical protein